MKQELVKEEVIKTLMALPREKAPRLDGMTAKVLLHVGALLRRIVWK